VPVDVELIAQHLEPDVVEVYGNGALALAQADEHAALRLVLLTGMDSVEIHAEAQAAGADAVVTKPFDRLALLSRLNSLLELPSAR